MLLELEKHTILNGVTVTQELPKPLSSNSWAEYWQYAEWHCLIALQVDTSWQFCMFTNFFPILSSLLVI